MVEDTALIQKLLSSTKDLPPAAGLRQVLKPDCEAGLAGVFDESFAKIGFVPMGGLRWVRPRPLATLHDVIAFYRLRGALAPCWAISFDFIPELVGRDFKVRPRPRHTPLHVIEDPIDFPEFHRRYMDEVWALSIIHGPARLKAEAKRLLPLVVTLAPRWFDQCMNLTDAVFLFAYWQQREYTRLTYSNYVNVPLAHACVLARLGEMEQAQETVLPYRRFLTREFKGHPLRGAILRRLNEALARCAPED